MATASHQVRIRFSPVGPVRRLNVATWLVRHGLLGVACRLLDGAPLKARFGRRSWIVVGRIVIRPDGTVEVTEDPMIELQQTRWQALLARLYWREPTSYDEACQNCRGQGGTRCGLHWHRPRVCTVCPACAGGAGSFEVTEMRPRRFAWLIRPLYQPEPIDG